MELIAEEFAFLNDLNDKQKKVCVSKDNILLRACPGSGKTRTLTYKLAYLAGTYSLSKKINVAITYTNRAADEIKRRLINLGIDIDTVWAGTIHQFCLEFIIRPYSMYSERISKGYHIIDEYISEQYLKEIANQLGIEIRFGDNARNHSEIVEAYDKRLISNKELDFDAILDISYQLVNANDFVCENISGLLRSLLIDEYQDTNNRQYDILGQIIQSNKKVQVMFVGDTDQAIYGEIGGLAKTRAELEKQFGILFVEEKLDGCYRSTQRIIDFYSNFQLQSLPIYALSDIKNERGYIFYEKEIYADNLFKQIAYIVNEEISKGVQENEICIVAPQWWLLFPLSNKIKEYLPNVSFDAPDITPIKYDPMNVFYLIARLVFTKAGSDTWTRKKVANEIIAILVEEYKIYLPSSTDNHKLLKLINSANYNGTDGIGLLQNSIKYLFKELMINLDKESILNKAYKDFLDKIEDRIKKYELATDIAIFTQCFKERKGVVICSFHGIKGEEYTTVIAFGVLNGYIPHWNTICNKTSEYRKKETNKLLYVVCSRAKENLFLFSEKGRITRRGSTLLPTDELVIHRFAYDEG